jgi:hypothetical protein
MGVRPSLNALLAPHAAFAQRRASLGTLAVLPDELLLHLLALLADADAARMCAASRFLHAFAALAGSWRERCLARSAGRVRVWHGSWRGTYAALASRGHAPSSSSTLLPAPPRADGLCSDLLYAPWRLSHLHIDVAVPCTLPRLAASSHELFEGTYAGRTPCILGASSFAARGWDLKRLCDEAGEAEIQAEAMRCTPETYLAYATSMRPPYADGVVPDESPLYLFDAQLPQRLGDNWNVPALLGRNEKGKAQEGGGEWDHDLFGLLGERRPDYRWVIAGPERSGSGVSSLLFPARTSLADPLRQWHKDPNATSAWNTILSGSKHWLFLPPHVTPPGVFVSHDEGEVTAPLSLAEWAEGYLEECRRRHGERGDGMLLEGRCEEGETVYVPTGWWHCVVNTSGALAEAPLRFSLSLVLAWPKAETASAPPPPSPPHAQNAWHSRRTSSRDTSWAQCWTL